jgi:hypothetical protein
MWSPIYLLLFLSSQVLAIWPEPVSFEKGNSTLWISESLRVTYNGASCANVRGVFFPDTPLDFRTEQASHEQSSLSSSSSATSFDNHSLVETELRSMEAFPSQFEFRARGLRLRKTPHRKPDDHPDRQRQLEHFQALGKSGG